jgi:hypothetical protein
MLLLRYEVVSRNPLTGMNVRLIVNKVNLSLAESVDIVRSPSMRAVTTLTRTGVLAALIANRTAIGTWEQFDLITD